MRYFFIDEEKTLNFLVCGMLSSKSGFLHMKRQFSDNVFILIKKGTLHISSNHHKYDLCPNQFIFLKSGEEHFGTEPSDGELEYYWVHVSNDFKSTVQEDYLKQVQKEEENLKNKPDYFFPETGTISNSNKIPVLFTQLLDFYMNDKTNKMILNYSVSLLFLELTAELKRNSNKKDFPHLLYNGMAWIKSNYTRDFSIQELADFLNSSTAQINNLFRTNLNMSIIQYTNKIRIEAAKNLLSYFDHSIKECAYECGFEDEKYFMKVFKKLEGITPTQYKETFSLKNVNK